MENDVNHLVGIPFVDGGRTKEGLDCWGLVKLYYQERGIDIEDYTISAIDTLEIEKAMQKEHPQWEKVEEPEAHATVLFRLTTDTAVNHAGVCLGDGTFLHAYLGAGTCVDKLKKWKSRIIGYYKPKA